MDDVLFACAFLFMMAANVVSMMVVKAVNSSRARQDQFSFFGWHVFKLYNLVSAYREQFPDGPLLRRFFLLCVLAAVFFVLAIALRGIR